MWGGKAVLGRVIRTKALLNEVKEDQVIFE